MQPKTYRKVTNEVQAMQWTKENQQALLDWLSVEGIGYTFHEINSAGELIIYTSGGPQPVLDYWWVVKDKNDVMAFNQKSFPLLYEAIDDKDNVV